MKPLRPLLIVAVVFLANHAYPASAVSLTPPENSLLTSIASDNRGNPPDPSATSVAAIKPRATNAPPVLDAFAPNRVRPGGDFLLTVRLSNPFGAEPLTTVNLTYQPPAGVAFVSLHQVVADLPFNCSTPPVDQPGVVSCTASVLPAYGEQIFEIVARVPSDAPLDATFTNVVTLASDTTNESRSVAVRTVVTDFSVAQTGPSSAPAGSEVPYVIDVTNDGSADVGDVVRVVVDPPAGTTYVNLGAQFLCFLPLIGSQYTVQNGLFCDFVLAPGESTRLILTLRIDVSRTDPITDVVRIASPVDADESNNVAAVQTNITQEADLYLLMGPWAIVNSAGAAIPFGVGIRNNGPSNASSVNVEVETPPHTTFAFLNAPPPWSCTTPEVGHAGLVSCALPFLAASTPGHLSGNFFNVSVTTEPAAVGTVLGIGGSVRAGTLDPVSTNNSTTTYVALTGAADLAASITWAPETPRTNERMDYVVHATNTGPSVAADVVVSTLPPENATLLSVTPSQGSCSGLAPIVCNMGNVPPGATATVAVAVTIGSVAGIATTTATVTCPYWDIQPSNNVARATITAVSVVPFTSPLVLVLVAFALAATGLRRIRS